MMCYMQRPSGEKRLGEASASLWVMLDPTGIQQSSHIFREAPIELFAKFMVWYVFLHDSGTIIILSDTHGNNGGETVSWMIARTQLPVGKTLDRITEKDIDDFRTGSPWPLHCL